MRRIDNLQVKSTILQRRTASISQVRRHLKSRNSIKNFAAAQPTITEFSLFGKLFPEMRSPSIADRDIALQYKIAT